LIYEIKDKDLGGRIGKLTTKSGVIETPAFFPVINPLKQEDDISVSLLKDLGLNQLITNAYIIKDKLGSAVDDVHKLLGFNGVVMTDSGAYQLLRYGPKKISIDPVDIVKFQDSIGSDIGVIADVPTSDSASYEEALYSVKETLRRAAAVLDIISESKTLWVLPIQGGIYLDLVRLSAESGKDLQYFSMYAIGSPVLLMEKYNYVKVMEMIITAKKYLPIDKPLHLFGAGHPMIIPFIVALGIDTFDSASYILYARDDRYMTEYGTYKLKDLDYLPCECPICSKYEIKSLIEMPKNERTRHIALHNLYVIQREIKRVKVAIREGRLWEMLEERGRSHPSLRSVLKIFARKDVAKFIEELDPRIKGDVHGIFLYDETSIYRPEVIRHEEFIYNHISMLKVNDDVILIPAIKSEKPFRQSINYRGVLSRLNMERADVFIYLPFLTLIPLTLDYTYPYSHFEAPEDPGRGVLIILMIKLKKFIKKLVNMYRKVIVVKCNKYVWCSEKFIKRVLRHLPPNNVVVTDFCIDELF